MTLRDQMMGPTLVAIDPTTNHEIDVSTTCFADDLRVVTTTSSLKTPLKAVFGSNELLGRVIGARGMGTNDDKSEHIKEAGEAIQAASLGATKKVVKHLGNHLDVYGTTKLQFEHRCAAFMEAYYSMGRIWYCSVVPLSWRLQLFKSLCISTLLSGMECETLTDSELNRMDVLVLSRLRKIVGTSTAMSPKTVLNGNWAMLE